MNAKEINMSRLVGIYLDVKDAVIEHGFAWEIDWQADKRFESINESDFLREAAWTVLSAGFRESVIRRLFGPFSRAFLNWSSARHINTKREYCRQKALRLFGHKGKIRAILDIAFIVSSLGFDTVKQRIRLKKEIYLQSLPYIGPVTSLHLAKNLGLPTVKPDRHLLRISSAAGYDSPLEMCREISKHTGESIQVIDITLWRYATLVSNYTAVFAPLSNYCRPGENYNGHQ